MQIDEEGHRTMALNNWKLTYATRVPRKLGSKQAKIQKRKSFLFPDWQETVDATVLLEFIKIWFANL